MHVAREGLNIPLGGGVYVHLREGSAYDVVAREEAGGRGPGKDEDKQSGGKYSEGGAMKEAREATKVELGGRTYGRLREAAAWIGEEPDGMAEQALKGILCASDGARGRILRCIEDSIKALAKKYMDTQKAEEKDEALEGISFFKSLKDLGEAMQAAEAEWEQDEE